MDVHVEILDAAGSRPSRHLLLDEVGADFAAVVKSLSPVALGVELVVVVFRNAAAKFDRFERPAETEIGAQVGAALRPSMVGCSASSFASSEKRIGTP